MANNVHLGVTKIGSRDGVAQLCAALLLAAGLAVTPSAADASSLAPVAASLAVGASTPAPINPVPAFAEVTAAGPTTAVSPIATDTVWSPNGSRAT